MICLSVKKSQSQYLGGLLQGVKFALDMFPFSLHVGFNLHPALHLVYACTLAAHFVMAFSRSVQLGMRGFCYCLLFAVITG